MLCSFFNSSPATSVQIIHWQQETFLDIPVPNAKRLEKSENLSVPVLLGDYLKILLWWSLREILVKQTSSF